MFLIAWLDSNNQTAAGQNPKTARLGTELRRGTDAQTDLDAIRDVF